MQNPVRESKAFTLIELLIVVAIIAILAAIAVPNFLEAQTRSKVARVVSDMRSISLAMESYAVDNNAYPLARNDQPPTNKWWHYSWFMRQTRTGVVTYFTRQVTTPVAYMGDMPSDPFPARAGVLSGGSLYGQDDPVTDVGYAYNNFKGAERQSKIGWGTSSLPGGSSPAAFGNGGALVNLNGAQRVVAYGLMSPGPARQCNIDLPTGGTVDMRFPIWHDATMKALRDGHAALYDPSNGTMSVGNIWRLN